ncbi:MAG: hypothetical protein WCO58_02885 [bacterium]
MEQELKLRKLAMKLEARNRKLFKSFFTNILITLIITIVIGIIGGYFSNNKEDINQLYWCALTLILVLFFIFFAGLLSFLAVIKPTKERMRMIGIVDDILNHQKDGQLPSESFIYYVNIIAPHIEFLTQPVDEYANYRKPKIGDPYDDVSDYRSITKILRTRICDSFKTIEREEQIRLRGYYLRDSRQVYVWLNLDQIEVSA